MNTPDMNTHTRPLGYWLKVTDHLIAAEFARAFAAEGATRRDWRLLNVIDGTAPRHRPVRAHRVGRLIERGWVAETAEGYALTDDGHAAKERLGEIVTGIRSRVTDAVSAEDLATTLASLEQIARGFGWTEDMRLPHRGKGRNERFGARGRHAHERGHGCGRHDGFAPRHDDSEADGRHSRHSFDPRGGHHRRGHGAMKIAHFGQRSYERGFEAGFAHGRDA